MKIIDVVNLTKKYGKRIAIENVSFDASKGEVLGLLGPNGAGKTTTMRILAGYMPPTSGKIRIAGYDLLEQSLEIRKITGYLPETVPLYTDMSVFDYLEFMAKIRGIKHPDGRIEEIVELLKLSDRIDSFIGNLSKGLRQRVGLAQALIHDPQIIILDEPTIGLDPAQIIDVRNIIQMLGKEKCVIFSTHILSEAQQICDRVLIINKGHIVAEDTTDQLRSRLTGSRRVKVHLQSNSASACNVLSSIRGVQNINIIGDNYLEFDMPGSLDVRPEVFKKLIDNNIDLLELSISGLSLEEIFLELTKEEKGLKKKRK